MRLVRIASLALVLALPALRTLAAEPVLKIVAPGRTVAFSAEEFAALPRSEAKILDPHDKVEQRYEGVAMRELLTRAGVPSGEKFRGAALSMVAIVHCKDGYSVVFSAAEFDEGFSDRTIILADRLDGDILPPSSAPLKIIAPGDKRAARWARQVTSIEIVSVGKP